MELRHGTVVMVADGTKLLLLQNEGDEKFIVLETLSEDRQSNPASHLQGTDSPGRTQSSFNGRRSSYSETDWHEQSEKNFAQHAAQALEEVAISHTDSGIVVIAAPKTLGDLRKHYGRVTSERLLAEIDKELAGHTIDDIAIAISSHGPK